MNRQTTDPAKSSPQTTDLAHANPMPLTRFHRIRSAAVKGGAQVRMIGESLKPCPCCESGSCYFAIVFESKTEPRIFDVCFQCGTVTEDLTYPEALT